jgi:hypothetical protein
LVALLLLQGSSRAGAGTTRICPCLIFVQGKTRQLLSAIVNTALFSADYQLCMSIPRSLMANLLTVHCMQLVLQFPAG